MSYAAARAALERMHLREVALSPIYSGFSADMRQLADADNDTETKRFLDRRSELCAAYGFQPQEQRKPFAFANGIAIIPVHGSLINRFSGSWGYVTGYNFIRSQLSLAMGDPDVQGIVFDVNSYGGEAAGCFELCADIHAARASKPSVAVVDSNAYSAGYAIACSASHVVMTPSSGVGSIGVLAMHVDMSKFLERVGFDVTFITSGEHKVDGNPYEPLSAEVRADIQIGVDKSRAKFVALVADHRSIEPKVVYDTEARTYRADDALALGLVDAIQPSHLAVEAFFDELTSGSNLLTKEDSMSKENLPEQATVEKAAADARIAERARIEGILNCEAASGRGALASHLAMKTEMSVEQAVAILAASPAEAAAAEPAAAEPAAPAANQFKTAMDADRHPEVGADSAGGESAGSAGGESAASRILNAQAKARGISLKH